MSIAYVQPSALKKRRRGKATGVQFLIDVKKKKIATLTRDRKVKQRQISTVATKENQKGN